MSTCVHSWQAVGAPFITRFVIDDWQGPTDAILQCSCCSEYALLQITHWHGRNLSKRAYAISPLPDRATLVFLKDMDTGYCDLARHRAEVDALLAAKGSPASVIGVDLDTRSIIATSGPTLLADQPIRSWRADAPDESGPVWLEFLKTGGSSP